MDQLTSRLLLYGDLGEDSILVKLSQSFQDWKTNAKPRQVLIRGIYDQVKALLDLATEYGFNDNLWQNYLTFLLCTNENSFSLISERVGEQEGSVNHFAKGDFAVFQQALRLLDDSIQIFSLVDIICLETVSLQILHKILRGVPIIPDLERINLILLNQARHKVIAIMVINKIIAGRK